MKQETIYITQNATFVKDIVFSTDGNPINLANKTFSMIIAKYFGDKTKYSVPIFAIDPSGGILRISISDVGTGMIPHGAMVYNIFSSPVGGERTLLLSGSAIIIPTV